MGGFKSGAAGDDWGDNDNNNDDDSRDNSTDSREDNHNPTPEPDTGGTRETSRAVGRQSTSPQLPWIHRRNSITDGREKTVQLHLQESTVDTERTSKNGVEEALGESVSKADLREAALLVGLEHVDEVGEVLQDWGYAIE